MPGMQWLHFTIWQFSGCSEHPTRYSLPFLDPFLHFINHILGFPNTFSDSVKIYHSVPMNPDDRIIYEPPQNYPYWLHLRHGSSGHSCPSHVFVLLEWVSPHQNLYCTHQEQEQQQVWLPGPIRPRSTLAIAGFQRCPTPYVVNSIQTQILSSFFHQDLGTVSLCLILSWPVICFDHGIWQKWCWDLPCLFLASGSWWQSLILLDL